MDALSENRKYNLSFQDGSVKYCIYEGISGNRHCFTTPRTKDEWAYYFLREEEFRASDSGIEVLTNQPKAITISRETDPVEFSQIQQAWNLVMESKGSSR